jgi:hypothetical protein
MAFNIDNIRIIKNIGTGPNGRATMDVIDLVRLKQDVEETAPEICFLNSLTPRDSVDPKVEIKGLQWSGECSSRTFDFFEGQVVPAIDGEIVALATWEGGEKTEIWHVHYGHLERIDLMNILKNPQILNACLNYDGKV